jgi:hypothetical protein
MTKWTAQESCASHVNIQPLPSQGINATNNARENVSIYYLYGAAQSMAMAAQASNTAFDPQSLNLLALAPWWDSTMLVLASRSSKCGLRLSRPGTATPLMASPPPTWQDTVPTLPRRSWGILPSSAKMLGQHSPKHPSPCHLLICLPCPPVPRRNHPIRTLSRFAPSASFAQMTLVASQSGHTWETNMS